MITELELKKEIGLVLNNQNEPKDILFFTGAGISIPAPSNMPSGVDLHRMLLEHAELFQRVEAEKLAKELCFEETVSRLSKLYDKGDINFFLEFLSDLFICSELPRNPQLVPNDYHKYFNWHLKNSGNHFTVNLDQLIESIEFQENYKIRTKQRATEYNFPLPNFGFEGCIVKIHGDPTLDEWKTQGYLYENIQAFEPEFKRYLDAFINKAKFVIFVGYGGVDKFDITPYFNEKPNGFFSNTNALWIQYGGNETLKKPFKITTDSASILSKFRKDFTIETIKPEIILNKLFGDAPNILNTQRNDCDYLKKVDEFLKENFARLRAENYN